MPPAGFYRTPQFWGTALLSLTLLALAALPPLKPIAGYLLPAALLYLPLLCDRQARLPTLGLTPPTRTSLLLGGISGLVLLGGFYLVTRYALGFGWYGVPHPIHTFLEELIAKALPEEFFFRGWLQGKEEERNPRYFLAPLRLTQANLTVSLVFAFLHLPLAPDPARLLVFFPSLWFGWARTIGGGIWVPTVLHGVSNFLLRVAQGG